MKSLGDQAGWSGENAAWVLQEWLKEQTFDELGQRYGVRPQVIERSLVLFIHAWVPSGEDLDVGEAKEALKRFIASGRTPEHPIETQRRGVEAPIDPVRSTAETLRIAQIFHAGGLADWSGEETAWVLQEWLKGLSFDVLGDKYRRPSNVIESALRVFILVWTQTTDELSSSAANEALKLFIEGRRIPKDPIEAQTGEEAEASEELAETAAPQLAESDKANTRKESRAIHRYTRRFTADEIAPVLAAACSVHYPIPDDEIEEEDLSVGRGKKRLMSRAEALVRRLEEIKGIAEITLEVKGQQHAQNAPSVHAKTLHAIEAGAIDLLKKIGAGSLSADRAALSSWQARVKTEAVPPQIWNSLLRPAGDEASLRENIIGIARIADWAGDAQAQELHKPQKPRQHRWLAEAEDDPWWEDQINDALRGICRIWTEVLGRKTGAAGGPLIKFSLACFQLAFGEKAPNKAAIRARIRRLTAGGSTKPKGRPRKRRAS